MARMPEAEWLGEHGSTAMTEASLNKVCLHTIVGNPPAHAAHFSVRADGHIFQSRDTRFQSAANLYGNDDVIAIENDDHGPEYGTWDTKNGHAVPGYTDAQMWGIAKILVWAYRVHGIPLEQCPDSKDGSEGIAYHRQGIDGNFWAEGYAYGGRVPGGETWTKSRGKVCPGDRRISQQPEIIRRARQLAGLDPSPEPALPKEDDVVKTYYVRGDATSKMPAPHQTLSWGDAVFLVEATADGMKRRHIQADELKAAGVTPTICTQAWVDAIPCPDGLFPWEKTAS